MGLLDELVHEEDLDPEVMRQTGSTYLNLSELEKIRHLIQMDLLDESQLLRNLSNRYGLPLLSDTRDEVQNHESPLFSKQLYERTGILAMRFGSKCVGLLSVQSNWLSMNQVAFQLGTPVFWHLAQQQQLRHCLKLQNYRPQMLIFLQQAESSKYLRKQFPVDVQIFILNRKKTNFG